MKQVLITGGAGFVGSNLVETFLRKGYRVYAIDNLLTGTLVNVQAYRAHEHFRFCRADITKCGFVDRLRHVGFDEIYHLACPTGVPNIKMLGEEMLLTSSIGTRHVLELARCHNAKLVFTSSCEVYGQPNVPVQEETYTGNVDALGPRSAYEEGKRFSETLIKMYVEKYGLDAKIVRIFNTYGPKMSLEDKRVIPSFLKCIKENKPLHIYGDGYQLRTYLYVDDLIEGLQLVSTQGVTGEAYNIGSEIQISVKDLALLMLRITGADINISHQPHFIEDHHYRLPAVGKIRRLGWKQHIDLEKGLRRMIASYAKRSDKTVAASYA